MSKSENDLHGQRELNDWFSRQFPGLGPPDSKLRYPTVSLVRCKPNGKARMRVELIGARVSELRPDGTGTFQYDKVIIKPWFWSLWRWIRMKVFRLGDNVLDGQAISVGIRGMAVASLPSNDSEEDPYTMRYEDMK